VQKITPFLWFDSDAEEAANFYVSVFRNSRIVNVSRYGEEGVEIHKRPVGSAMVVEFEIEGQRFQALNGGPHFKFSGAISFMVNCDTQEEVDHYWEKLRAGGDPEAQQCGWLKDKFGVTWQVIPKALGELLSDPDPEKAGRVMNAMLQMKKIDIAGLREAYES
jgi:predicted 3-demethylubiquinone-9 3-methyltransferase (glyoxalase superfamily)